MRTVGFDRMVSQTTSACGGDGFACIWAGAMLGHESIFTVREYAQLPEVWLFLTEKPREHGALVYTYSENARAPR
jgi:hypothetical protein